MGERDERPEAAATQNGESHARGRRGDCGFQISDFRISNPSWTSRLKFLRGAVSQESGKRIRRAEDCAPYLKVPYPA